jgi:CTP:molybdopterin cytidylyltransferase MocA
MVAVPEDRSDLAAVVLAAGAGTRLRPLTTIRPKALCPVGNVPLVDHAIARAESLGLPVAVNVHHGRDLIQGHLAGRVHLSIEHPLVLGTAGALGALQGWIAGRDVLVLNADAWHRDDLRGLLEGWDRRRARLLTVTDVARGDFGTARYVGAALLPAAVVGGLQPVPSGLGERVFRPMEAAGDLELAGSDVPFFDCGTIADYHAANMASSGGANVVGEGAVVEGSIERTVLWPGARVAAGEVLLDAIRTHTGLTVSARG